MRGGGDRTENGGGATGARHIRGCIVQSAALFPRQVIAVDDLKTDRVGNRVSHLGTSALVAVLLYATPAFAAEPLSSTASWTAIDLGTPGQLAFRHATVTAAPDKGPGVIRLVGTEDPPPLLEYPGLGMQICDVCTFVYFPDIDLDDGMVEVEINSQRTFAEEQEQRGFAGVIFNANAPMTSWEAVYFRPHNAVESGEEDKSTQYTRLPMENWFYLRGGSATLKDGKLVDTTDYQKVDIERASRYEGVARGIAPGQWFTARLVIAGDKIAVFVRPEGANEFSRALTVQSFNEPTATGPIGLYAEPRNTTFFRNARYLRMSKEEALAWLAMQP